MKLKQNIVIFFILMGLFAFQTGAQSDSTTTILPKWEVGDKKVFNTADVNYIYLDDSLVSSEKLANIYYLEVIDKLDHFVLGFSEDKTNLVERDIPLNSTLDSVLLLILTEIDQFLVQIKYDFEVDENARVIKLKNQRVYIDEVKRASEIIIERFSNVLEQLDQDPEVMLSNVRAFYLNTAGQAVMDIQQKLIHLLRPYVTEVSKEAKDTVLTREIITDELTIFQAMENLDLTGKQTTEVTHKNGLTVSQQTEYDKEQFLKKMKIAATAFQDVKPDNLVLIERAKYSFDKSTWLNSTNKEFLMAIPGVKIVRIETVRVE